MTLKQLELFLSIVDHRSFSKGAEAINLVQSTASQHIRSMEDELDIRLLDRSKSGVQLTEAGRLFAEHARRICDAYQDALLAMRRFQGGEEAILRIGASTIPAACLIPDLLGKFASGWPGIRMEVLQGDTSEILRLLQADLIELAMVGGRFDTYQVEYQEVATEQIVLVARASVELTVIHEVGELKDVPMIVREPGSGTRQVVDAALIKAGFDLREMRVAAQLGSSEAVRRAVLGGAGMAFISTLAVSRELTDGSLVIVPVPDLNIQQHFYLAWNRRRTLSPAALAFKGLFCFSRDKVSGRKNRN